MQTILVADDSTTVQQAVEIALRGEPVKLVRAMSGADAIARVKAAKPDLVLLDHQLSDQSGYDVAAALQADSNTASVPVVMLSGTSVPYDEDLARRSGVQASVAKPFDCITLVEQVRLSLGIAAPLPATATPPQSQPMATSASPFSLSTSSSTIAGLAKPPSIATPQPQSVGVWQTVQASSAMASTPAVQPPQGAGFFDLGQALTQPASIPPIAAVIATPAAPIVVAAVPVATQATAAVVAAAVPAIVAATGSAPAAGPLSAEARAIVERIAWEVVPELAETIIREEIRRLLGNR